MDNYESIITDTGGCGPFQVFHAITTNIVRCLATWGIFMLAFGIYDPGWRCATWANDSLVNDENISFTDNGISLYNIDTMINHTSHPQKTPKTYDGTCEDVHLCSEIEFDPGSRTFVTDFGLICDRSWILSLLMSVQFAGHAAGCVLSGSFADRFGRKLCLVVFFTLFAALQVISAFSTNWQWYGLARFLIGICDGGILSNAIMFSLEVLTERWRVITSMVPSTFVSLIFLGVIIYFERNWRIVQETMSLICLSLLIPFLFLPESPRWLMAKGHTEKAEKVVAKIAKMNSTKTPNLKPITSAVDQNTKKDKQYTFLHLFTENSLRYNNTILTFVWILNVIAYFVLSLSVKAFSGDFYINLIISFTTEVPFQMIGCVTVARFGRRYTCIVSLALASVSYFVILASFALSADHDGGTVASIFFQIAKSLVSSVQSVVVLITAELSPTVVRVLSHSFFRFISRLASVVSPFLIPSGRQSYYVSFSVLNVFSLVTASLIYLLPETKGLDLSDKIAKREDLECFGADKSKKACRSGDIDSPCYGSVSNGAKSPAFCHDSSDEGKMNGVHQRTID